MTASKIYFKQLRSPAYCGAFSFLSLSKFILVPIRHLSPFLRFRHQARAILEKTIKEANHKAADQLGYENDKMMSA
jgi:hypothetical protein